MIRLNVHEAKTHLSRYLSMIMKGETILLCKRNQPIAETRPLQPRLGRKRPIGLAKGQFAVPKEFFEPLPEEIVQVFQGISRVGLAREESHPTKNGKQEAP
jgi:antitoxin (DNA-binding transcriptional repressor) of toxin-antitoxin stability system